MAKKASVSLINTTRMIELAAQRGHTISLHTLKNACQGGFIANARKISLSGRATTENGGRWFAPEQDFYYWLDCYAPKGQKRPLKPL